MSYQNQEVNGRRGIIGSLKTKLLTKVVGYSADKLLRELISMKKSVFYLFFLTLAACGVKHTSVEYGQTSKEELISAKGVPLEEKSLSLKNSSMLIYPDNEKYQLKDNVVVYGLKDPREEQKSLIFWKHKFKDCKTTLTRLPPLGHLPPEIQYSCPEEGLTVVYSEGSDFISRIIEHEK